MSPTGVPKERSSLCNVAHSCRMPLGIIFRSPKRPCLSAFALFQAHLRSWRSNSMLYWFGVYTLVAIAVVLPLLALYIVAAAWWLGLAAVRLMNRRLKNALARTARVNEFGTPRSLVDTHKLELCSESENSSRSHYRYFRQISVRSRSGVQPKNHLQR